LSSKKLWLNKKLQRSKKIALIKRRRKSIKEKSSQKANLQSVNEKVNLYRKKPQYITKKMTKVEKPWDGRKLTKMLAELQILTEKQAYMKRTGKKFFNQKEFDRRPVWKGKFYIRPFIGKKFYVNSVKKQQKKKFIRKKNFSVKYTYLSKLNRFKFMAFAFKIRRKKFMYRARPWRRRSKRYKLYLYRSTTNRVVFKYWYKDKIFGYKWKWFKF